MAKKKNGVTPKIPVSELKINTVYRTYVRDIVKILKINEATKTVVLYNVTGSFRQWVDFKNIYIVEKLY